MATNKVNKRDILIEGNSVTLGSDSSGNVVEKTVSDLRAELNVEDGATAQNTTNTSLTVVGSGTKTITLTDSDGGTVQATFTDLQGAGGGTSNPNITVVNSLSDITNAGSEAYLDIQGVFTILSNYTPPANQTWHFSTGLITLDTGVILTGNNTSFIPNGNNVSIDSFEGSIDGSWSTPRGVIYSNNFGARPDGIELQDGGMTSGSNIFTSIAANFTNNDIGKTIVIYGALSTITNDFDSVPTLVTTITGVTDQNTVTVADNATRTVSNTRFYYGSDNFDAGKNAIYVRNQQAGEFVFTPGMYLKRQVEYPSPNPWGTIPNTWTFGNGTDDIRVLAYGTIIKDIPAKHTELTSLVRSHSIKFHNTKRSSWRGGLLQGDFNYHNYSGTPASGTLPDEAFHGLVISSGAYDTVLEDVNLEYFTGDGHYTSGTLQFTNYIKGTAASGYPGVSEFVQGSISDTGVIDTNDTEFAYTNALIPLDTQVFENTRVKNPSRDGRRYYQFSGSSFAGWSGLLTPRYTAFYYDSSGTFLRKSKIQEFYKTYQYDDDVSSLRLQIEFPLDLTVIDAQVRAPINPEGVLLTNVNVSDCGRHGGANLATGTTWRDSYIKNIGNTLPAYGINVEDQRRAAKNISLFNLTFENCHAGAINFVGTENVRVDNVRVEPSTDPGRLLHPDYVACGFDRGRNVIVTNSTFKWGSVDLGRNNVFSNNIMLNGRISIESNSVTVEDNELHNVFIRRLGGTSINNRIKSLFKSNRITYDGNFNGSVFENTDMQYDIIDVDVNFNDISRINSAVTDPDTFKPIDLSEISLFTQVPAPGLDYGGIIKDFSFRGARPAIDSRDFNSANPFPITDIENLYSETSISLTYGLPKNRTIENFKVDGWLAITPTQFGTTLTADRPLLTFKNLNLTIPEGVFNWTNTGANIFETSNRNYDVAIYGGNFDLNVASGVIGSSNRFIRLAQLGTILFDGVNFHSETVKNIDFTNTLQFPASTGAITIIYREKPDGTVNFTPRPQDRIIHAYLSQDGGISALETGTPDGSSLVSYEDVTDGGRIKKAIFPSGGGGSTNLAYTASPTDGTIESDTGTNAIIPAGSITNASLQLPADKTKLDGIESGATADQTGAEIKAAYEAEANTNAFTDAEQTKLAGIETAAKDDQNANEVPVAATPTNYTTASADVEAHLSGIDTALGSATGLDTTQNLYLNDGDNLSPELGVQNVSGGNTNQFRSYLLNTIAYLENKRLSDDVRLAIRLDASSFSPTTNGTIPLGAVNNRWSNGYINALFANSINLGGDDSGFVKNGGGIDFNTYLQAPDISNFTISRSVNTTEFNGTVVFTGGADLTYTITDNATTPSNVGTRILVTNLGANSVTITAGANVTLSGGSAALATGQSAWLIHRVTDEWMIININ